MSCALMLHLFLLDFRGAGFRVAFFDTFFSAAERFLFFICAEPRVKTR